MVISTNLGYLGSQRGSYLLKKKKGSYESLSGTQLLPHTKSTNQISIWENDYAKKD